MYMCSDSPLPFSSRHTPPAHGTRRHSALRAARLALVTLATLTQTPRAHACDSAPLISAPPMGQTVCVGEAIMLGVSVANADGSEAFQWRRNDAPLPGQNMATLVIANSTPSDSGDYDVVVSTLCGATTSPAALVVVAAAPVFSEQPQSQSVCDGADVTLRAAVAAQGDFNSDVVGAASASSGNASVLRGNFYRATSATTLTRIEHYLTLNAATTLVFYVYESNSSSGPFLKIAEARVPAAALGEAYYSSGPLGVPLLEDRYYLIGAGWPIAVRYHYQSGGSPPPHPATTGFGASQSGFQASYSDPLPTQAPFNTSPFAHRQRLTTERAPVTFQWRRNGVDLPGAVDAQLTVSDFQDADAGDYQVDALNGCGLLSSSAIATLTYQQGPRFRSVPGALSACAGSGITLRVLVNAQSPTFQWTKEGNPLPGATAASYRIDNLSAGDSGTYRVSLQDVSGCGEVVSPAIPLTVVSAAPVIVAQSQDLEACAGAAVSLTVSVDDSATTYQWSRDGNILTGATSSSLPLDDLSLADAGVYEVAVRNACGATSSAPIQLTVSEPAVIEESPADVVVCAGGSLTLTVRVSGTAALQWRRDGFDLPGETSDTLMLADLDEMDQGAYELVVTNGCGASATWPSMVAVTPATEILAQPESRILATGRSTTLAAELGPAPAPSEAHIIAAADQSSSGPRLRGNAYVALSAGLLTRIEHELDISVAGPLTFFVYEAPADAGPFVKIAETRVTLSGVGRRMHASPPMATPLLAGRRYIIGAGWSANHRQFWATAPHPHSAGALQSYAGYAASFADPLPSSPLPDSPLAFHQRLTIAQPIRTLQWLKDGVELLGANQTMLPLTAVDCADAGAYRLRITDACDEVVSTPAMVLIEGCGAIAGAAPGEEAESREQQDRP